MSVLESQQRIAFVTSNAAPQIHFDDIPLAAALQRRGVQPVAAAWSDPRVDWSTFDAVLMRTAWDYFKHYPQFLRWLDRMERDGIALRNPVALQRWNSDKHYLLELERGGVRIVPTQVAAKQQLAAQLSARHGEELVVKPTVSGGAWHTVRGRAGDADLAQAIARLPDELDYLLQPFLPEILDAGEYSLMFFASGFSHAVCKRAAAADYRVQEEFGGRVDAVQPPAAVLAAARRALAVVAEIGHREWDYARVDGVVHRGDFLIMEIEMIEPRLFFTENPAAAEILARQLVADLRAPAPLPRARA